MFSGSARAFAADELNFISNISLDEVKVTQKGDDGHSSAIINSALYSAHGGSTPGVRCCQVCTGF